MKTVLLIYQISALLLNRFVLFVRVQEVDGHKEDEESMKEVLLIENLSMIPLKLFQRLEAIDEIISTIHYDYLKLFLILPSTR